MLATGHAPHFLPENKKIKLEREDVEGRNNNEDGMDIKPDIKVLEEKILKLEKEEKARNALVLHSENIPDRVLKDLKEKKGIKIKKGGKFQPLKEGNPTAYKKGVEDGKEINLNQRTIKNQPESNKLAIKKEKP